MDLCHSVFRTPQIVLSDILNIYNLTTAGKIPSPDDDHVTGGSRAASGNCDEDVLTTGQERTSVEH